MNATIIFLMSAETPLQMQPPALCPSCGYDMRASIGGRTSGRIRCPGCGDTSRLGDIIRPQLPIRPRWPVVILAIAPGPAMLLLAQLIPLVELDSGMMLILAVLMTVVHVVGLIFIAAPRARSQGWFTATQATLLCLLAATLDGLAIWACTRAVLDEIALM